jgi:ATP-dependent RNA circularization protein (DNA/RNA ligase family)
VDDSFVKFPRTPHLFWLGRTTPRADKVLDPVEAGELLRRPVAIEEKVDGACVGISLIPTGELRVQNRGSYLAPGVHPQFRPLWSWLAAHEKALRDTLASGWILFGEWCYAQHSVYYDALSDWFLAFDVYDRQAGRFWSRERRNELAQRAGIATVPFIGAGTFGRTSLEKHLGQSMLGSEPMEGLYLRWDEGPWLVARAKLVRASWVEFDEEHWSKRPLRPNRCRRDAELW